MYELVNQLTMLLQEGIPSEIWLIVQVVIALILLFIGQKSIRLWLALAGLSGGAYLGVLLTSHIDFGPTWNAVAILSLAVIGALILSTAYKACFFIGGFIGGISLGRYVLDIFFPLTPKPVLLLIALATGLIAVFFREHFEIWATAITGAMLFADASVAYLYKLKPGNLINRVPQLNVEIKEDLIILLGIALLTLIGAYVQKKSRSGSR